MLKSSHLIGIISDTHDNIYSIDEVVEKLNEIGVDLVLHA
ncbi:MAG: Calcineurin-like phosphoesterase superfamily domain, partial [Thermoproteota archaeon]|nr:Calcineurin-like phosphoesterase superfamily domain [Thermoproteota archaeon]